MPSCSKTIPLLLLAPLGLSFCTPPPPADDFAALKAFDYELTRLCGETVGMRCYPTLEVGLANARVVSLKISGRGMKQLPKSVYGFEHLRELVLEHTAFDSLPPLQPFAHLTRVAIVNNPFRGPLHLRGLPATVETLVLSRDAITEVLVDDTLPKLARLDLTQNAMQGRINSSFCKLPALTYVDLSFGCCTPWTQQAAIEKRAKAVLCKQDVTVYTRGNFPD